VSELTDGLEVIAFDIVGTTVDWHTGVTRQVAEITAAGGIDLDAVALADAWRDRYVPSMAGVRAGARPWADLDTFRRESLDERRPLRHPARGAPGLLTAALRVGPQREAATRCTCWCPR
jgi:FMN phosphatase YigB (HAD superfamily)